MAARKGSAEWNGDLRGGTGRVTVGDGAWTGDYSFTSRFEEGEGTNPEELIAAAHASCFAMALSGVLAEGGHPADSIKASAGVSLRRIDDAPTVAQIDLDVVGSVPGIDEAAFVEAAETAKKNCPISRALASVPEINLSARLA